MPSPSGHGTSWWITVLFVGTTSWTSALSVRLIRLVRRVRSALWLGVCIMFPKLVQLELFLVSNGLSYMVFFHETSVSNKDASRCCNFVSCHLNAGVDLLFQLLALLHKCRFRQKFILLHYQHTTTTRS